jgi:ribonucleotide reductase beta subunit family protein with ferritin-like domain
MKERGLLPGLCSPTNLSAATKLYTEFAILLHHLLLPENRISEARASEMIVEAVEIETNFTEALPCAMLGMNAEAMTKYIQFSGPSAVADGLLKHYNT